MEDILLYICSENKCLPYLILDDGEYKFIGFPEVLIRKDEKCEIIDNSYQIILPIEGILDESYFVNSDGVIEYRKPFCSKCGSHDVIKKDFNWKTLCLESSISIKVKRYLCRNCNKKSQTEFFDFFKKYFNFCNKIMEKIQINR